MKFTNLYKSLLLLLLFFAECSLAQGEIGKKDNYLFPLSGLELPKQINKLRFDSDKHYKLDGRDSSATYRNPKLDLSVTIYVYRSPEGTNGPVLMLDSEGKEILETDEKKIQHFNAVVKLTTPSASFLEEYDRTIKKISTLNYKLESRFRFMAVPKRKDTPIAYAAQFSGTRKEQDDSHVPYTWKIYLYSVPGFFVKIYCTYPSHLWHDVGAVDANFIQAINWDEISPPEKQDAEQGDAAAQHALGRCYAYGYGVPKAPKKAVSWYAKAADQGYAPAQHDLGGCYAGGLGVTKDWAKAVSLYTKAADQDFALAQYSLGLCYAFGTGVDQNFKKAVSLYTKASEQGYAPAQYGLGRCYAGGHGVPQDPNKAVSFFTKSADQGFASAQYFLGLCYAGGHGVPQDLKKAVSLYTKAAKQGDAQAQYDLGVCYYYGKGVPKNLKKAKEWIEKSKDTGLPEAIKAWKGLELGK